MTEMSGRTMLAKADGRESTDGEESHASGMEECGGRILAPRTQVCRVETRIGRRGKANPRRRYCHRVGPR